MVGTSFRRASCVYIIPVPRVKHLSDENSFLDPMENFAVVNLFFCHVCLFHVFFFCFCFILILTGDKFACHRKLQHSTFITVDRKSGCSSIDKSAEFGTYFTVIYCTKCDQTIALSVPLQEKFGKCVLTFLIIVVHSGRTGHFYNFSDQFFFFISFNVTWPSVMLLLAIVLSCQYWKEDKRQLEFMWRGT